VASLDNKTILLTGASQGIGAATATVLCREGARLIAHHQGRENDYRKVSDLLRDVPRDRKHFVSGDFEDNAVVERVWQEAVAWRGHVDVLVLNAAMMVPAGGFDDTEEVWNAAWQRHYQVNVQAPARLMRAAVRHFCTRSTGVIILMSSWVAQRGAASPKMLAYAASKAAIKAVAQSVARAHAEEGIYTYIIAPGIVSTRMSVDFAKLQGGIQNVTDTLAMAEWVPPEELGKLIAFLAQGTHRHLTGATLDINGATYIR
jgi:NAD(P)-dependent dehydrogenase (short-subunit alcohol dehydrogenase family)